MIGKSQKYTNSHNYKKMVLNKSRKCKLNQDELLTFLFLFSTAQGHILE